jgi:hypothetical protein
MTRGDFFIRLICGANRQHSSTKHWRPMETAPEPLGPPTLEVFLRPGVGGAVQPEALT